MNGYTAEGLQRLRAKACMNIGFKPPLDDTYFQLQRKETIHWVIVLMPYLDSAEKSQKKWQARAGEL